jgi:hypothetical protein
MSTPQHPRGSSSDPATLAQFRQLAGRVDAIGSRFEAFHRKDWRELAGEVAACKRAIAKLAERDKEPEGQPNWLEVAGDPAAAKGMLEAVADWVDGPAHHLGVRPTGCWPWHPQAVVILMAGAQHYRAAYAGENTLTVVELVTRYATAVHQRASEAIGDLCNASTHRIGEAAFIYDTGWDVLERVAYWWATDREGLPPGLRPRD